MSARAALSSSFCLPIHSFLLLCQGPHKNTTEPFLKTLMKMYSSSLSSLFEYHSTRQVPLRLLKHISFNQLYSSYNSPESNAGWIHCVDPELAQVEGSTLIGVASHANTLILLGHDFLSV